VLKKYLLLLFLLFSGIIQAQFGSLSPAAEISIITIGPGSELYDKFGHSAYRIKDSLSGVDVAFNYGVYDFDTPNFYTKFAQGKLLYELRVDYYQPFLQRYIDENRWVKEQVLNLTHLEKQAVSDFLWNNALPQNKKYKYDFFYDNCATKIRDVLIYVLKDKLEYTEDYIQEELTFRELIQQNLQDNSWGSLGIDVALGAVIDRKAQPIEYQFLPDYIYKGAEHALIHRENGTEPLVKKSKLVFKNIPVQQRTDFLLSPFFVLGLFSLLILFVTYKDYRKHTRNVYLDAFLFLLTGVLGVFLVLLWFATDHTATAYNYNMLWAFPISLFFVYSISRRSAHLKKYTFLLISLLVLLLIHWITGVQIFAVTLIPVLIALAVRYLFLFRYFRNKENVE